MLSEGESVPGRSRLAGQASLYALEAFLAPHLGGRVESPDEELRRCLDQITSIDSYSDF